MATWSSVPVSLGSASVTGVLCMVLVNRSRSDTGLEDDITPKRIFPVPLMEEPSKQGHVMVMIDYCIDPKWHLNSAN